MANADRPRGFRPVGTMSGAPVAQTIRYVGVADGEDIGVGDMLNLESGLADPMATNDSAILGVAVGFGKVDADGIPLGPYNPLDLENPKLYDDSANTHTDWVVYYAPATDCIFEVQTNADLDLVVGDAVDLVDGAPTVRGSIQEVGTSTNADFQVVALPKRPDNDNSLANADVHVIVTPAERAFADA